MPGAVVEFVMLTRKAQASVTYNLTSKVWRSIKIDVI